MPKPLTGRPALAMHEAAPATGAAFATAYASPARLFDRFTPQPSCQESMQPAAQIIRRDPPGCPPIQLDDHRLGALDAWRKARPPARARPVADRPI
jgi:hypothetical protein